MSKCTAFARRALFVTVLLVSAAHAGETYQNPIGIEAADPFIFHRGDMYYLYGTAAGDGLLVWTSKNLVHWTQAGYALKRTDDTWSRRHFWAPELFEHRGQFYLHFTALGREGKRRIVLSRGDSPLGPFTELKAPWFEPARDTIDSHVFRDDDGRLYLYSVYLSTPQSKCFEINVRKLNDELGPANEATFCISPSEPWEGEHVNEGPFVLRRGDTYFLTWSANGYTDPNYSVGVATSKSPLGPWTKSKDAILKRGAGVSGPGHHCFIDSPDQTEWFIAYHRHIDPSNPRGGRELALDRIEFVNGGSPTIRVLGPTTTPQPMPSGAPAK